MSNEDLISWLEEQRRWYEEWEAKRKNELSLVQLVEDYLAA